MRKRRIDKLATLKRNLLRSKMSATSALIYTDEIRPKIGPRKSKYRWRQLNSRGLPIPHRNTVDIGQILDRAREAWRRSIQPLESTE